MVELEEVDPGMEELEPGTLRTQQQQQEEQDDDDYEDLSSTEDEEEKKKDLKKVKDSAALEDDEEEEDFLEEESLVERLAALIDIVPPLTRAKLSIALSDASAWTWSAVQMAGSGLWILSTGLLLTLLPMTLELERERAVIDQEHQQRIQQQQAQQLLQSTEESK